MVFRRYYQHLRRLVHRQPTKNEAPRRWLLRSSCGTSASVASLSATKSCPVLQSASSSPVRVRSGLAHFRLRRRPVIVSSIARVVRLSKSSRTVRSGAAPCLQPAILIVAGRKTSATDVCGSRNRPRLAPAARLERGSWRPRPAWGWDATPNKRRTSSTASGRSTGREEPPRED